MPSVQKYRSLPELTFRRAWNALRGRPDPTVSIIGGAHGPTAVFVARGRRPKYNSGSLEIIPDFGALTRAFALAVGFLAVTIAVAGLLSRFFSGRRRYR